MQQLEVWILQKKVPYFLKKRYDMEAEPVDTQKTYS
jgi:hypothetical protein